jgi:uncharacterized protein YkwD
MRYSTRRSYRKFDTRGWKKYFPAIALLVIGVALASRDIAFPSNGNGGVDWRIGKPQVTFWDGATPRSLPELRSLALKLINRDRQINGLPPLVEDPLLAQAAQLHADDMRARRFYDHVTPEGRTPTDRLAAVGGQGGVGENIALQYDGDGFHLILNWELVEKFQKGWMYSDGHRANLLNSQYTRVGYGIAVDPAGRRIYAVQNFQ